MYKHLYSRFLAARPETLDFSAHSHHYWPDVTRDAVLRYWDDSAKMAGDKWEHVFAHVIPEAQRNVAGCLDLASPEQIVFGTNTHEFVCRVLSSFPTERPIRLLTTDSEFHSFRRQMYRLTEAGVVRPTVVAAEPIGSFADRFSARLAAESFDLVYLSHTFFNSGFVVTELERLLDDVDWTKTQVMIDAYHSFCALPVSYRSFGDRVFVTGGGYKYAQAGEGACFLSVPRGCLLRPRNTGWYSSFATLEANQSEAVQYGEAGQRFAGATFDPSGVYRYNAAMSALADEGLDIVRVHDYVVGLQRRFLDGISALGHRFINPDTLLYDADRPLHGHFLTFELPSPEETAEFAAGLRSVGVEVDYRGARVRFGFGLYQDAADVETLVKRL